MPSDQLYMIINVCLRSRQCSRHKCAVPIVLPGGVNYTEYSIKIHKSHCMEKIENFLFFHLLLILMIYNYSESHKT